MTILHVDRALTIYGWLGERRRNPNRSNGPESACKIPPWRGWPIPGPWAFTIGRHAGSPNPRRAHKCL